MTRQLLACEAAERRTETLNGLRLEFLQIGPNGAPAICFLHGGAAHAHWFDRVIPTLADRFHAIALDQRGHGESQWATPPAYATEDFARDLLALMDRLGYRRMTLVGHSMGGHNAMAFAAWYPERTAALVVVDSRPYLPPDRVQRMRERGRRAPRVAPGASGAAPAPSLRRALGGGPSPCPPCSGAACPPRRSARVSRRPPPARLPCR